MKKIQISQKIEQHLAEKLNNLAESAGLNTREMLEEIISQHGNQQEAPDNSEEIKALESEIQSLTEENELYREKYNAKSIDLHYLEKENKDLLQQIEALQSKQPTENQLILNISPVIRYFLMEDQAYIKRKTGREFSIEQIILIPYYSYIKNGAADQHLIIRGKKKIEEIERKLSAKKAPETYTEPAPETQENNQETAENTPENEN
jgi:septal ring factor EnvC (AmiA/AmiB activator)